MIAQNIDKKIVLDWLEEVMDPEVPVLSVVDLGIVRDVKIFNEELELVITPTYSGCPAMDMITAQIRMAMAGRGFKSVKITQTLQPAWTTDWMSEAGRNKLKAYGIAPPLPKQTVCEPDLFQRDEAIQCPQCGSWHTKRLSEFGSTACKALYQCQDCQEPFDYFKCH
jgi:ring-1,2-phenylacetyl-CoA epoxidase subunit PaaD